ncbi:MAG: roadblock/LC7 domain-containing protein [Ardenticatenaceae bacterium]
MIQFKVDQLQQELELLRRFSPAVNGSLILSSDGFPLAEDLPSELGEERTAAKAAAMLALGERIAFELGRGNLNQLLLGGKAGYVIVALINESAALTVLCKKQAKMAMALLDIAYTVEELQKLL